MILPFLRSASLWQSGLALALASVLPAFSPCESAASFTNPISQTARHYPKVLVIGDSLTVGPFGDRLEEYLVRSLGDSRVYIFALCGSSPEHWLESEPDFRSRCGYRFKVPRKNTVLGRHENGHPPEVRSAPKVEALVSKFKPEIVIVQLGTNWFDLLAESRGDTQRRKIRHIIEQFHAAVRRESPAAKILWITPPDSSRFRSVQSTVTEVIQETSRNRFDVINSSKMIRYEPGKSGGDGVHLAAPAAEQWFEKVRKSLRGYLSL